MRGMMIALLFSVALTASAKPWNGVEAGVTKRDEIVKRFGEPSRSLQSEGKEVLAYYNKEAIKGTTQTQFKIDPANSTVERIDVFPSRQIDKDTVEQSYGSACPAGKNQSADPCYMKKLTDDFRTYFLYPKLGLAIFFNEDGKTVHSFIFQTLKAAK